MPTFESDISHFLFETKLIEGAFERLPRLGADPTLWPIVEQRLGRGVGCRVVVMHLASIQAKKTKPVIFMPPPWWKIEGQPEKVIQTWTDEGERGERLRTPLKPRPDAGLLIEADALTVFRLRIEGQPLDITATEAYALAYAEAVQETGGRVRPKYDKALRPIAQARLGR